MYEENNFYQTNSTNNEKSAVSEKTLNISLAFSKMFLWMFLGLIVTFGIAFLSSFSLETLILSLSWPIVIIVGIIQIIICFSISKQALVKLNKNVALILFLTYSALNGFLFGSIFVILNAKTFVLAFGLTAGLFLFMGLFGLIFKNAARKLHTFAYVGLVFLLIASLISFFVTQDWLITAISALGIIVFSIITMVDMRFIVDMMNNSSNPDSVSIYGAFVLYLDFINIFLYIVRIILSSRKN